MPVRKKEESGKSNNKKDYEKDEKVKRFCSRMKRVVLLFGCLLVFGLFLGNQTPLYGQTADEYVAQGDSYLEAHNTVDTYQSYLAAYNLDNNHPGANFGLALLILPHSLIDSPGYVDITAYDIGGTV